MTLSVSTGSYGLASFGTIKADLIANEADTISEDTISSYCKALKEIFVVEDSEAWNPNLRSKTAIRTSDTRYFTDPSIATAALGIGPNDLINDLNTFGLFFETMAVRDLRVYAEALNGKVYHYRDKNGLECDAIYVARRLEDVRCVRRERCRTRNLRHHRLAIVDARELPHLTVVQQFRRVEWQAYRLLFPSGESPFQRNVLRLPVCQHALVIAVLNDHIQRQDITSVFFPPIRRPICPHAGGRHIYLPPRGIAKKNIRATSWHRRRIDGNRRQI